MFLETITLVAFQNAITLFPQDKARLEQQAFSRSDLSKAVLFSGSYSPSPHSKILNAL
jgi:hypothetical protein